MREIIEEIKKKKEYKYIDDSLIEFLIKEFKDNIDSKNLIKNIRRILHELVGIYEVIGKEDVFKKFFKKLDKKEITFNDVNKILSLSISTRERIPYYRKIYDEIFKIVNKDKVKILDLACGLNPFSIFYILDKVKLYVAVDISVNIVNQVNELLTKLNKGYSKVVNLLNELNEELTKVNYDLVFLWKTAPLLEKVKKGAVRRLLEEINYEYFVISFSKKTLGLRRFRKKDWERWLRKILEETKLTIIHKFEIPNEKFFIIKKGF